MTIATPHLCVRISCLAVLLLSPLGSCTCSRPAVGDQDLQIESLTPNSVILGNTAAIEIHGTGFYVPIELDLSGEAIPIDIDVTINGVALTDVVMVDATLIEAVVPATVPVGLHDLWLGLPTGKEASAAEAFEVLAPVTAELTGPAELTLGESGEASLRVTSRSSSVVSLASSGPATTEPDGLLAVGALTFPAEVAPGESVVVPTTVSEISGAPVAQSVSVSVGVAWSSGEHSGTVTASDLVQIRAVILCSGDAECIDACHSAASCVAGECDLGPADKDSDGDSYIDEACGGDDCDDNPAACGALCFPGNPDLCDGWNNDCDALTDEDFVPASTCGLGVCEVDEVCNGVAGVDCTPGPLDEASDVTCDGLDGDCDGPVDEEFVSSATSCGVGQCAGNSGLLECIDGTPTDDCDPLAGAGTEGPGGDASCSDGADNDCNGLSDGADPACGAVCTPGSTGFLGPSADAADTGGDGDGFEDLPTEAYTDGGGNAANNNGGTGDRHLFFGYGFDATEVPAGCDVLGIELRLDWWLDSGAGTNAISVEISWDGGTTWSGVRSDASEPLAETTVIFGDAADRWGHLWLPADIDDTGLRVRVTMDPSFSNRDFLLDWIPINVHYGTLDSDGDGLRDVIDTCPNVPDPLQTDVDGDGAGEACDCDDTLATGGGCASGCTTYYPDLDGDGFGDANAGEQHCTPPGVLILNGQDCEDDPAGCGIDCSPLLTEDPGSANCADGEDNDCDGPADGDDPACGGTGTPPVAIFEVTPGGGSPATVFSFDAAPSWDLEDADGALVFWWDWQADGFFDDTGLTANHSFVELGPQPVVLMVEDTSGYRDYHTAEVLVFEPAVDILVTSNADTGAGTLRDAIDAANLDAAANTISFAGPMTITLASNLPPVSAPGTTIVGSPGVVVDGSGGANDCLRFDSDDNAVYWLEIAGCGSSAIYVNGQNNRIAECDLHDNLYGVWVDVDVNQVGPGNAIHANGNYGIYLQGSAVVADNRIYANSDGIFVSVGGDTITGNLIFDNLIGGIWMGSSVDAVILWHNTLHGNGEEGADVGSATNLDIRNNLFSTNGAVAGNAGLQASGATFTALDFNAYWDNAGGACGGCTPGAGHLALDPLYIDAASDDFRLTPVSPCIDAGQNLGLDLNDARYGDFNASGPDIGAWEAP